MKSHETFAVSTIGVAAHELQALNRIFSLCSARKRTYELQDATSERDADIYLVDADDPGALAQWVGIREGHRTSPSPVAVMITASPSANSEPYSIRRPLLAPRIVAMLDRVVISELGFAPEIRIGEGEEQPTELQQVMTKTGDQPQGASVFKALVVDDSLPVRKQIGLGLAHFGAEIDYAESGERAIRLIRDARYDIIFLDVVLPGVDGYQICRLIRRNQATKRTPVVMLTGKSSPFDRVKGTLAGCDSYLTKPVEYETFKKTVKRYVA